MCLSAGRTKATLVEPVTPNTQKMTAASVRLSRQCGLGCSVQSQKRLYRDSGGCGGGGGGGVPVLSHRPVCGRGCPGRPDRRLKAHTRRRANCVGLSSIRSWILVAACQHGAPGDEAPRRLSLSTQANLSVTSCWYLVT